jgi:hypothetical protein
MVRLKNCALLGYYAASNGKFLSTFRDNLSVPSWRVKNQKTKPTVLIMRLYRTEWSGDKFSEAWCQPVWLMQAVRRDGDCSRQCISLEESRSRREEILTCAVARRRRTSTWAGREEGKERKCNNTINKYINPN